MADTARIHNLDALRRLKQALWRFQEIANVALTEAESELQRTGLWLETEQRSYWANELRKRHEAVERAKAAVREKQLYKDAGGSRSSAVDEMQRLQVAQRKLAEAEQKVVAVKRAIPLMQKQTQAYRGGVQRFATTVQSDLPTAVAKLEQMLAKLEAYVALDAGGLAAMATSTAAEPAGGMARPAAEEPHHPPASPTPDGAQPQEQDPSRTDEQRNRS